MVIVLSVAMIIRFALDEADKVASSPRTTGIYFEGMLRFGTQVTGDTVVATL